MVYTGLPVYLTVVQGSAYTSREMRENLEASDVNPKEAPIETPGAIGTMERYHDPLRVTYEKLRKEMSGEYTDPERLQMAVSPFIQRWDQKAYARCCSFMGPSHVPH